MICVLRRNISPEARVRNPETREWRPETKSQKPDMKIHTINFKNAIHNNARSTLLEWKD